MDIFELGFNSTNCIVNVTVPHILSGFPVCFNSTNCIVNNLPVYYQTNYVIVLIAQIVL